MVLSLIGLTLFFTVPRFQQVLAPGHTEKAIRWLMAHSASARVKAVTKQTRLTLHVGIRENRLWFTEKTMSKEEALLAQKKALVLEETVRISGVEVPGRQETVSGTAEISFYPDGHADPAFIHLKEKGERQITLFIEPFLPKIRWLEADVNASR